MIQFQLILNTYTPSKSVWQSHVSTFHAEIHLILPRDGRAQTFAPLGTITITPSNQGSRGGWFRPRLCPHSNCAGQGAGSSGRSGRVAVFIMSIASSSKTKTGNARPGAKERVVAYGLHLGVSFYPLPCTRGSNRTRWMDGLEVLEVYLWVLSVVVHRRFYIV